MNSGKSPVPVSDQLLLMQTLIICSMLILTFCFSSFGEMETFGVTLFSSLTFSNSIFMSFICLNHITEYLASP